MISQKLTIMIFFYITALYPYILYPINKSIDFMKLIMLELLKAKFKYGYNGQLYCNGFNNNDNDFNNNDSIDIIIANHPNGFYDIMLIILILNKYNINNYNFICSEFVPKIPGLNLLLKLSNNIIIKQNYSKDYQTIINGLDKIIKSKNKEFIIIFPEGDVLTSKEAKKNSQRFSKENNLPILNNVLVPKAKGLFTIVEYLKKHNKLGTIHDFTVHKKINDYYIDIKQFEPKYDNYEMFKKQLYSVWFDKEKLIDKMNEGKYKAPKVFLRSKQMVFLLLIFIIVLQTILLCNSKYLIFFICYVTYFYYS